MIDDQITILIVVIIGCFRLLKPNIINTSNVCFNVIGGDQYQKYHALFRS